MSIWPETGRRGRPLSLRNKPASIVDGRVLLVEGFHDEVASDIDKMTWERTTARLSKGGHACFLSAAAILRRCIQVIRHYLASRK
jgi:hypothetical protein